MGMLNNGLVLMGLSVAEQTAIRGLLIILAVSLSMREQKA
jgi:ribose transport system permease protein